MSTIATTNIKHASSSSNNIVLNSDGSTTVANLAGFNEGKILQVLQNTKLDVGSTTSTSFVDTGLSQAITPSSSSSKILCMYCVEISHHKSVVSSLNLVRGSTAILQPSSGSNQSTSMNYHGGGGYMNRQVSNFLDSPNTTSATTYKVQYKTNNSSYGIFINTWYDSSGSWSATSSLTLMEIAA